MQTRRSSSQIGTRLPRRPHTAAQKQREPGIIRSDDQSQRAFRVDHKLHIRNTERQALSNQTVKNNQTTKSARACHNDNVVELVK